jgi:hypothetical protein
LIGNKASLTLGSIAQIILQNIIIEPCTSCLGTPINGSGQTITTTNGPIEAHGFVIEIRTNLKTTGSGDDILLRAQRRLQIFDGTASTDYRSLQTNNGDIVLWTNSINDIPGGVVIGDWVTLNSANGSTNQTTGGGRIWIAGGSAVNADGLPTGPANGGDTRCGVSLGTFSPGATTTSIYSGGGDVYINGESNGTSGNGAGVTWNRTGICHSGNGTITIKGEAKNASGFHGIELGAYVGSINILSSGGSSSTPAIAMEGKTARSDFHGMQTNGDRMQATGAGGISIVTIATNGGTSWSNNLGTSLLAASGDIFISAQGGTGLRYAGTLGKLTGSDVTSSSSNITLRADQIFVNGAIAVDATGALVVEPFGTSFTNALSWPISNFTVASGLTGLRLGKSTNTSNITFVGAASIAGPITAFGGNISVNENLNTITGAALGDVLLKATGDISLAASKSITTSGGDVILWANSDNEAANGSIALRNGSSIVTGSSSVAGGHVWLSGGSDGTTWNGLAVGSGYAVPGTSFTPSNGGGAPQAGIYLERNSISSFGGNIKIAGDGAATSAGTTRGIVTYGNTVTINAGSGKIELDGQVNSSSTGNRGGVLFGLHDSVIASTVNILSSATTGDAITINGVGRGAEDAIGLSGTLNITSSGGGNIFMNGNALGAGRSIVAGNFFNGILNVFANSGTINLNGNTKAVQVAVAVSNGLTSGPSKINIGQGGTITSSSSDVFITADNIALAAGGIAINSTGKVTVESSTDSFASALTYPITNLSLANTVSGLTLGKATNTQNITFGSATTIAGPITAYGGTIALTSNLASSATTGAGISLIGKNIVQNAGIAVTTSGANLEYLATDFSTTSAEDNTLKIGATSGARASINAGSGNISLTGSFGTTSVAGGTDFGLWLFNTDVITSGTGLITLTGDATNTLSTESAYGISMGNATIKTESGAITLNGTGGKASGNSRGIVADAFSNKIVSVSGPITLNEIKPIGLTGTYTGLYMNPASNTNTFIGADGTDVASSSSSVTITGDRAFFDVNSTFRNNINTSGAIVLESVANSFETDPSLTGLTISGNPSSVRVGKTTNTANITLEFCCNYAAGPIEVYAGYHRSKCCLNCHQFQYQFNSFYLSNSN